MWLHSFIERFFRSDQEFDGKGTLRSTASNNICMLYVQKYLNMRELNSSLFQEGKTISFTLSYIPCEELEGV